MDIATIYHNPRCGKSRAALELLEEQGVDLRVIPYLSQPPTVEDLARIVQILKLKPADLLRRKELIFRDLQLDESDDEAVLAAIAEHPVLLERPIILVGKRGVIGRPVERVLELFPEE